MKNSRLVKLYDTTLRDGSQGEEISFSVEDKLLIAQKLDDLGIHYIEAGWPGSNPKDLEFFTQAKSLKLKKASLVAFGSTRRSGVEANQDSNLLSLVDAQTPVITIFGKSWDLHVKEALKISQKENLDLIFSSLQFLKSEVDEVIYDAEHFFDGFKANPDYALQTLKIAQQAGADWIVLCDTNGGALPHEISEITQRVVGELSSPLGIHCHNDGELAVANSLAAIAAGARQIHGTINGIGERCGNANLVSVIPNLALKLGFDCIRAADLKKLKESSRYVAELANLKPSTHQAFVGNSAFAHKGGIHVSAVRKNPSTYEHIDPELVGNHRRILVSDLSGVSNIVEKAEQLGFKLDPKSPVLKKILKELKKLENEGFQFEGAEASFEILIKKEMGVYQSFFELVSFRVIDEKIDVSQPLNSEATVKLKVKGVEKYTVAKGEGPVNALDNALRAALQESYACLKNLKLIDYKVRVLNSSSGTQAKVRVLIETSDGIKKWSTVGVSTNVIEASYMALVESIEYKLLQYYAQKSTKR